MTGIKCGLNKNYKEALQLAKSKIKKEVKTSTIIRTNYFTGRPMEYPLRNEVWMYGKKKINAVDTPLRFTFSRLSCCGIDEAIWTGLASQKQLKRWSQQDFNAVVAWYISQSKTRNDKRVVITGLPMDVRKTSQYDVEFYKKLKVALLHFGFMEVPATPYLNKNSRNKITVLIGRYS